ncbi:hypothetical protein ACWCSD_33660 [Nonomuraea sp. NPDC001684]
MTLFHAWQRPYGEAEEEAKAHLRKAADHVLWRGAERARSTSSVEFAFVTAGFAPQHAACPVAVAPGTPG